MLLQLCPHGFQNQTIMNALLLRPVGKSLTFEGHPVDPYLAHVLLGGRSSVLGVKGSHSGYLIASVQPRYPIGPSARVGRPFRIEHHLPKTLHAGVTLAVQGERSRRKVRENSEFVPL